ncbi:MAG: hypothetical protein V3S88_00565 [Alphaproteobacteria bacterium]
MTDVVQGTRTIVKDHAPKPRVEVVARAAEDRDLSKAPRTGATTVDRYLLVLRFAVFNLAAFALLGAAYLQGWVGAAPRRTAALRGANVAAWELPCQARPMA